MEMCYTVHVLRLVLSEVLTYTWKISHEPKGIHTQVVRKDEIWMRLAGT